MSRMVIHFSGSLLTLVAAGTLSVLMIDLGGAVAVGAGAASELDALARAGRLRAVDDLKQAIVSTAECVDGGSRLRDRGIPSAGFGLPEGTTMAFVRSYMAIGSAAPKTLDPKAGNASGSVDVDVTCSGESEPRATFNASVNKNGVAMGGMAFDATDCDAFFTTASPTGRYRFHDNTTLKHLWNVDIIDPEASCTPDVSTACLGGGRFAVTVPEWKERNGKGEGLPIQYSPDHAAFVFGDKSGTKLDVKVVDGCKNNDHFWVFAAAASEVEYILTVTDTETGQDRMYLGAPAQAITDTSAFATCP